MLYNNVPKVENISKYKSYKILAKLIKPKSPVTIIFMTNDPDEWTIDKIQYKTKSGEIVLNEGINANDYEYWVNSYIEKGYELNQ